MAVAGLRLGDRDHGMEVNQSPKRPTPFEHGACDDDRAGGAPGGADGDGDVGMDVAERLDAGWGCGGACPDHGSFFAYSFSGSSQPFYLGSSSGCGFGEPWQVGLGLDCIDVCGKSVRSIDSRKAPEPGCVGGADGGLHLVSDTAIAGHDDQ